MLLGDPVALAWEWMENYADSLKFARTSQGYPLHIITARDLWYVAHESLNGVIKYIRVSDVGNFTFLHREFWDHFSVLTQEDIPQALRRNFLL